MKLKFYFRSSYFIKIRPVGAELLHADRQTRELMVALRNVANAQNMIIERNLTLVCVTWLVAVQRRGDMNGCCIVLYSPRTV